MYVLSPLTVKQGKRHFSLSLYYIINTYLITNGINSNYDQPLGSVRSLGLVKMCQVLFPTVSYGFSVEENIPRYGLSVFVFRFFVHVLSCISSKDTLVLC